jgi:hypothetical protein
MAMGLFGVVVAEIRTRHLELLWYVVISFYINIPSFRLETTALGLTVPDPRSMKDHSIQAIAAVCQKT